MAERNKTDLTESILSIKSPSSTIYRIMRDIVCDARFYSVTYNDSFWKTYGEYSIRRFLDSITDEEWNDDGSLTLRKEEFLNEWMASNMLPLSAERRKEIEMNIRLSLIEDGNFGMPDPEEHDGSSLGVINLGDGIKDTTERTGLPTDGLPPDLKDYMEDAIGSSTPDLHNDGHEADVRFLTRLDPSIVRLAEKIGRRGGHKEYGKGMFRRAPKSDISGVTVGNDLNALLPSELALLASPCSEKIFLDRYIRKRLQIFSSVSRARIETTKRGPIYICLDTSGSMVGEPEELAKSLALAISITAQKEHRPVCIFNYSDSISFFVLKDLKEQRRKLLKFLSDSYGGGNNENKLFNFLFKRMPKLSSYKGFAKELRGADILLVSDFLWNRIEEETAVLIDRARLEGMRVFTVGIKSEDGVSLFDRNSNDSDESYRKSPGYRSGRHFFMKSDCRNVYENGRIKEYLL